MNSKIKKLAKISLVGILMLASTKLAPSQAGNLENKIEELNYKILCLKEIGGAKLRYIQKNNNYIVESTGETGGIINTTFFNRIYHFKTEGHIEGENFLPRVYKFSNRDKANYHSIEAEQYFDFKHLKVNSKRFLSLNGERKLEYNKTKKITPETRDIMSVLMELRTMPIKPEYKFEIIEKGEIRKFISYYEGIKNIKINNTNYKSYKFRIVDVNNSVKNLGQEARIYLNVDASSIPLKIHITNYFIGNIILEYR